MSGHMPTFERIPNDPYRATAHGTRRALRILWEGEGLQIVATGSDRIALVCKCQREGWRWVGWQDGDDGARVSVYRRVTDAGSGGA